MLEKEFDITDETHKVTILQNKLLITKKDAKKVSRAAQTLEYYYERSGNSQEVTYIKTVYKALSL